MAVMRFMTTKREANTHEPLHHTAIEQAEDSKVSLLRRIQAEAFLSCN